VVFDMTSADVIHAFWVPLLGGKRDLTPTHTTRILLTPTTEGRYLGQCAEFCGVSHANMRIRVFVDGATEFHAWAAREAKPAPAPVPRSIEAHGQEVFSRSACIACHTLAGVDAAQGTVGPNLSHIGSRGTIAAGLFRNTLDTMRLWIQNAPALKPGSQMPAMDLPAEDLDAIVAFLRSRR
jgi:cytochrome c oxidase subunit 2